MSAKLDIGGTIKYYRQRRSMTQMKFAKKLRMSQAQIARLKAGQQGFRSSVIIRMAKILGVPPWALFTTPDERKTMRCRLLLKD